jgi:hypothetical protein
MTDRKLDPKHVAADRRAEAQPLLPVTESENESLPKGQLAILLLVQICEIVNFSVILPFIGEALLLFNIARDQSRLGHYSGLIEVCGTVLSTEPG